MAVFGWVMLVVILLGGAGALAYVMLFNQKPAAAVSAEAGSDGSDGSATRDENVVTPDAGGKLKSKKGDKGDKGDKVDKVETGVKTGSANEAGSDDDDKGTKAGSGAPKTNTAKKNTGKFVAAIDDKLTWRQVSEAAKKAEAKFDWGTARLAYERLEKAKGYQFPGYAVYKQAHMAFQANDTAEALTLAQRASTMPGNQKADAKLLYAEALFKQGDYKRAKDFYIGLRKVSPDAKKKILEKKIAACNAKLSLPARDGITD
jgi:hypothetical protein